MRGLSIFVKPLFTLKKASQSQKFLKNVKTLEVASDSYKANFVTRKVGDESHKADSKNGKGDPQTHTSLIKLCRNCSFQSRIIKAVQRIILERHNMETYPITPEQIAFYQENGYIQLHDVLTDTELQDIRDALEDVNKMTLDGNIHVSAANPEYEKVFVQKVNLWRVHEATKNYVFNHKIAEIARTLAQTTAVRLWHDHALIKMPGDSKASNWHQDLPYWPMNEVGALSCWMALDDVFPENGCMSFVPKSHSWGKFDPIHLVGVHQDIFKLVPEPETKDLTPLPMPMKAGSCTIHNGLTFHYAGPNQTDKPRRAMVTIYMPEGITFNGKPHVVTNGLNLEAGKAIEGEIFPVLAEG